MPVRTEDFLFILSRKDSLMNRSTKKAVVDPLLILSAEEENRARLLHEEALVIDTHSDVHLDVIRRRGRGEKRVMERLFYDRWKAGGVDVVVLCTMAKFGPDPYPYYTSPARNYLLTCDAIAQEIAESPQCFMAIRTPEDIHLARERSKVGLMLGLEGAEALESDLGLLRCYYRLGMRVMTLTWHQRNLVADGVAEPSNAGLSNFGHAVVEEMRRNGVILDVSHLSPRGVEEVTHLYRGPVIASHSNARAVHDHQRNLYDDQIRAIAATGGVIGVVFLGRFVAGINPSLQDVLDHVDHIVKVAGVKHVAIGPDYVDGGEDMVIQSRRVAGPGQPVNDKDIPYARGLERIECLPGFTRGLISRGYTDDQIKGILGGNFLRVFEQVKRL